MNENGNIKNLASELEKSDLKAQNIKNIRKLSELILIERKICLIAPVCPDYPLNSKIELGEGMPVYTIELVRFLENFLPILKKYGILYQTDIILADTETDLEEIVVNLAKTKEKFLFRCAATTNLIGETVREKKLENVNTKTFSSFFKDQWHKLQYEQEEKIKNQILENQPLKNWLEGLAYKRTEKYETQFKRILGFEEKLNMAIRHFGQYSALAEWMREKEVEDNNPYILINSHSPNLRAMSRPLRNERIKKIIVFIPLKSESGF